MLDDLTISLDYVRVIAEQLRRSGASVDEWLRQSGMPEEPHRVVSYPAFRRLVLNALAAAREPALGLHPLVRCAERDAEPRGEAHAAAALAGHVAAALDDPRRDGAPRRASGAPRRAFRATAAAAVAT